MTSIGAPDSFPATNLYRTYFEHANLGFALTSPDKGWLHVNPCLCEMLGYSEPELRDLTWVDLTHPDDLTADVAQFARLLAGEIDAYELDKRFIRKDGRIVPTHLTVACERDDNGKVAVALATLTDLTARQAMVDALKLSEERFQLLADSTLDGLWDWDIRADSLWLSPSWKAQVGYRDAELVNAFDTWDGLIHPEDHPRVMEHLRAFLKEPAMVWQDTFRLRHRLGDWRQILARAIVVLGDDDKPTRMFGVHVDITSERQALAELQAMTRDQEHMLRERARELAASEVRYRNIADHTFDWETWIDADGELRYCSPACERITGHPATAFMTDPGLMERIIHPRDHRRWQAHMQQVVHQRQTQSLTYRILRPDDTERWLERMDHPILSEQQEYVGTRGSTRDITNTRAAQHALEQEKTFVETVLSTARAIILVLDTDARIVRVNPYIAQLTGRTADDLIGRNWIDTCLPERDRAQIHEVFRNALNEQHTSGYINPILAADGSLKDISWYDELIRDEDGSPRYLVAVGIDVTDQRRAEQALREVNEQLEDKVRLRTRDLEAAQAAMIQSEKLSSLGTLVAGLSHEVNNPLMGAINYVEHVRDHSPPELAEILDKADRELKRIGTIARNLLRYARPNSETLMPVDLREVAHRATDLLAADLRARHIQVIDQIPTSLPQAQGDLGALQQVCLNLLINARDAVAESERREIAIRGGEAPGAVWLEIADTGHGIPEKLQSAIYDPFFSTKPPGKGTGLGLPISLSIVDSLGGRLELCETGAAGTVFRMTLPAVAADKVPA